MGAGVDHYENFPVASVLCPPRLRPPIVAIYRFARTADDLADEGDLPAAERLAALAAYRAQLTRIAGRAPGTAPPAKEAATPVSAAPASPAATARAGVARAPAPAPAADPQPWADVFEPLARAMAEFHLPPEHLHALLDAFEQDVRNPPYADREALLDYCRRSANPVGRLLLHLYGIDDAASLARSDDICTALQLINFWQDLGVDAPRGRHYVPAADAQRHGVTHAVLRERRDSPRVRALVRELCGWAAALMQAGAPLALQLPGRAGWELRLVVQGGLRILEKIARIDHASLVQRPRLRAADLPPMLWRAWAMKAAPAAPPAPSSSPLPRSRKPT